LSGRIIMLDFLTFNSFITPKLLIIAYYFGLFFITALFFIYKRYFLSKFIELFKIKNKRYIWIFLILLFICMQICLRVFFEIIIAYFDIHDVLYEIKDKI
jgi:hypothetical protein